MSKPRLLLVEDDTALAELLQWHFEQEGYDVVRTPDGEEALLLSREAPPDIVLLDWMIEGLSGIEVCRRLRRATDTANVPIIMLTARGEEEDRIRGLETGADDYVTKPFDSRELSARVRSVLRRPYSMLPDELKIRDIVLDLKTRVVSKGSASEHLMPRESAILEFFMRHPNQVYSSQELVKALWESDKDITQETARSWMRNLRTKLENIQVNDLIRTIPKTGYVLDNDG